LKIEDILHPSELNCSLISWRSLKWTGFTETLVEESFIYSPNSKMIRWIVEENKESIFQTMSNETIYFAGDTWHPRLGHIPPKMLRTTRNNVVDPKVLPETFHDIKCHACNPSKSTQKFPKDTENQTGKNI
jgi:hypothetical protein